jgi:hypothetical protein
VKIYYVHSVNFWARESDLLGNRNFDGICSYVHDAAAAFLTNYFVHDWNVVYVVIMVFLGP